MNTAALMETENFGRVQWNAWKWYIFGLVFGCQKSPKEEGGEKEDGLKKKQDFSNIFPIDFKMKLFEVLGTWKMSFGISGRQTNYFFSHTSPPKLLYMTCDMVRCIFPKRTRYYSLRLPKRIIGRLSFEDFIFFR